jgi:hypothetical protein
MSTAVTAPVAIGGAALALFGGYKAYENYKASEENPMAVDEEKRKAALGFAALGAVGLVAAAVVLWPR